MSDMNVLRILYVEDDDATREAFQRFLKPRTGKLAAAASGEEGLQKFEECRPNLIIVDLIMPGMSGLEMIGEIRKNHKDCHIMITSSVKELDTVLEAVDLGIDHYIVKPIDTDDLLIKMEGIARAIIAEKGKTGRVNLIDAVTILEKTVAANRRNLSLSEQFRRVFYGEISPLLEDCVERITGYGVKITSMEVDGLKRVDKIVFTVL